jgi:hypothetical protein
MKTRERRRAAWNLRCFIGKPLREINVISAHNVELGFFGKLPMVSASTLCISATCS